MAHARTRCACTLTLLALAGCADEGSHGPGQVTSPPALPYDLHQTERENCAFDAGASSRDSVGPHAPRPGKDWHVVVLMMENRSFDHYFSGLRDADTVTDASNPYRDADGGIVEQYRAESYCLEDLQHEWGASHLQYDDGELDGFVASSRPNGKHAMAYYTEEDLPFAHWLVHNFGGSDHHFASLLGPTWPNRLFMFSGTSCGYTEGLTTNVGIQTRCGAARPSILTQLTQKGIPFKVYDESGILSVAIGLNLVRDLDDLESVEAFEQAAKAGTLPRVSFVSGNNGSLKKLKEAGLPVTLTPQNDDHPKANIQRGQRLMYDVVAALMSNPEHFRKTILFITYDEHGGFFDHVPPPSACEPTVSTARYDYKFDRYGFRVPFIVVSPAVVRPGYVSEFVTDHTSITRFIEHWLGLPALTRRDANAWPLLDLFDFDRRAREPIVPELPPPPSVKSTKECP